jgi:hypothetical protein
MFKALCLQQSAMFFDMNESVGLGGQKPQSGLQVATGSKNEIFAENSSRAGPLLFMR